jgi:hypothetical protein
MYAPNPPVDGMLVEPIRIARKDAPAQRARRQLFAFTLD